MFMLAGYLSKLPKMALLPLVVYAMSLASAGLSVLSMGQDRFKVLEQMDQGIDKVMAFCEGDRQEKEQVAQSLLQKVLTHLSPKALYGYERLLCRHPCGVSWPLSQPQTPAPTPSTSEPVRIP